MAHKVWYRYRGHLEVDVVEDRKAALRRAAAIFVNERRTGLSLTGIEDDSGGLLDLDSYFQDYLRGYRIRGLDEEPVESPKWYVEVWSPVSVREDVDDDWVRVAIEPTRERAERGYAEAEAVFGASRVRIRPALAVQLEAVAQA
jgi:hypothetical protein